MQGHLGFFTGEKNFQDFNQGIGPGRPDDQTFEVRGQAVVDRIAGQGVDFSDTMLAIAKRKNKRHIRAGKVRLHLGDFDAMPFDGRRFDTTITVSNVYFWPQPEATMAKIAGLLRPGGRLAVGFHEKAEMQDPKLSRDVFRFYTPRDMDALLATCGAFQGIEIISRKGKTKTLYCAFGTK